MSEADHAALQGMYANDVAYVEGCDQQSYEAASAASSVLELCWRLELDGEVLKPTWPIVILSRDVAFNNPNDKPMEVGVQYGWTYW